ncbi:MAG: hypothetical protein MJZ05_13380 [Fibrobacter sp.]|nr:hypothetical protein [Fibrobacter sp.]
MKLQDAYVAEVGTGIGGWKKIGYAMANSSAFTYGGYTDNASVLLTSGKENAWTATANGALNDCKVSSVWSLDVVANANAGGIATYKADITNNSAGDCSALTPNFERLSTGNNFKLKSAS